MGGECGGVIVIASQKNWKLKQKRRVERWRMIVGKTESYKKWILVSRGKNGEKMVLRLWKQCEGL